MARRTRVNWCCYGVRSTSGRRQPELNSARRSGSNFITNERASKAPFRRESALSGSAARDTEGCPRLICRMWQSHAPSICSGSPTTGQVFHQLRHVLRPSPDCENGSFDCHLTDFANSIRSGRKIPRSAFPRSTRGQKPLLPVRHFAKLGSPAVV